MVEKGEEIAKTANDDGNQSDLQAMVEEEPAPVFNVHVPAWAMLRSPSSDGDEKVLQLHMLKTSMLMDLKAHLEEMVETCFLTSYVFVCAGRTVPLVLELSELDGLEGVELSSTKPTDLYLQKAAYAQDTARSHVFHTLRVLFPVTDEDSCGPSSIQRVQSIISAEKEAHSAESNEQKEKERQEQHEQAQQRAKARRRNRNKQKKQQENGDSAAAPPPPPNEKECDVLSLLKKDTPLDDVLGSLHLDRVFAGLPRVHSGQSPVSRWFTGVRFSAWGPPTSGRSLRGDLLYVDVGLAASDDSAARTVCVTACADGFFVNRSTAEEFSHEPAEGARTYQSLAALLIALVPACVQPIAHAAERYISNKIVLAYDVAPRLAERHPEWHLPADAPRRDQSRSDRWAWRGQLKSAAPAREWNKEYWDSWDAYVEWQHACARGEVQPGRAEDAASRSMERNAAMHRLVEDEFAEAAVKAAQKALSGQAIALNALVAEDFGERVFFHEGLVITVACNGRMLLEGEDWKNRLQEEPLDAYSAHQIAYRLVGNDINALDELQKNNAVWVTSLENTAAERVAERQQQQQVAEQQHVSNGDEKHGDDDGTLTYTTLSAVVDLEGYRFLVQALVPGVLERIDSIEYGSVTHEVGGVGALRYTPRLRAVAVRAADVFGWSESTVRCAVSGEEHQIRTAVEVKGVWGSDGRAYLLEFWRGAPADMVSGGVGQTIRSELCTAFAAKRGGARVMWDPNEGSPRRVPPSGEAADAEQELRAEFDAFVRSRLQAFALTPDELMDGEHLSEAMHGGGLSMRHLGLLLDHMCADDAPKHVRSNMIVVFGELLARCAKHDFDAVLREHSQPEAGHNGDQLRPVDLPALTAAWLTKLLAVCEDLRAGRPSGELWERLCVHMRRRFNAASATAVAFLADAAARLGGTVADFVHAGGVLRRVCRMRGIVLQSRTYGKKVRDADVLAVHPQVRVVRAPAPMIQHMLQLAQQRISLAASVSAAPNASDAIKEEVQQQRVRSLLQSWQLLSEVHLRIQHTMSTLSREMAAALSLQATVLHLLGDAPAALDFTVSHLRIAEKLLGPDHFQVRQAYEQLGRLCAAEELHVSATHCFRRAVLLNAVVCGAHHTGTQRLALLFLESLVRHTQPDIILAYTEWLQKVAVDQHVVEQVLQLRMWGKFQKGDTKGAIEESAARRKVLIAMYGAGHARVKESEQYIAQLLERYRSDPASVAQYMRTRERQQQEQQQQQQRRRVRMPNSSKVARGVVR